MQKTKNGKKERVSLAAKAKPIVRAAGKMAPALTTLSEPLTHQDEAALGYLTTLSNPCTVRHPVGPPLSLGSAALRTIKAEVKMAATIVCNASGFGFAHLLDDCWTTNISATVPAQPVVEHRLAAQGGVGGSAMWYSNGSYPTTTGPAVGAVASASLIAIPMPQVDGAITTATQMRLIAFGVQVEPIDTNDNTSGQVYVCSTMDPYSNDSALVSTTQALLENANPDILSVQTAKLSNWNKNDIMSTFAVPSDAQAFLMFEPPATGNVYLCAAAGRPTIGVYIYGAATNQKVYVRASYIYEFEKPQDNRTDGVPDPQFISSPSNEIGDMIRMSHAYNTGNGPAPLHSSGLHNSAGVQAFTQHLVATRPTKVPALIAEAKRPSPNWAAAAGQGLNLIADKVISFLPKKLAGPATFIKNWLFD